MKGTLDYKGKKSQIVDTQSVKIRTASFSLFVVSGQLGYVSSVH